MESTNASLFTTIKNKSKHISLRDERGELFPTPSNFLPLATLYGLWTTEVVYPWWVFLNNRKNFIESNPNHLLTPFEQSSLSSNTNPSQCFQGITTAPQISIKSRTRAYSHTCSEGANDQLSPQPSYAYNTIWPHIPSDCKDNQSSRSYPRLLSK